MKSTYVFALLLLVVLCDEQANFFHKIAHSDFGQTVIETLQLELGQENTVGKIKGMLKNMLEDVEADQTEADKVNKGRSHTCQQKIVEIDATVKKAQEKRAEDEELLPLKQEELQNKQGQSQDKDEEVQRNKDKLSLLVNDRKKTRAAYEERRDELTGLVVVLKQAKAIIAQLSPEVFLEKREEVFAEVQNHFHSFKKLYPNKRGYNPLVTYLLEMSVDSSIKADPELVGKVVQVFDDLIESIYDLQTQEMAADDAKAQAFLLAKTRFEQANKKLDQSVATLDAEVQTLAQKMLELTNDIATQQQIIDTKAIEKGDWVKSCDDDKHAYDQQTKNRSEEAEILRKTIAIFEKGLSSEGRTALTQIKA